MKGASLDEWTFLADGEEHFVSAILGDLVQIYVDGELVLASSEPVS
jgi:hypothetical protein